jgi:hypothetical protein
MSKMSRFSYCVLVANAISMVAYLSVYAWGSHSPSSLAIGIVNGFVMMLLAIVLSMESQS